MKEPNSTTEHGNKSYVPRDLVAGEPYVGELRSTVAEILDTDLIYKDESQEWLQKWWAVRVRALLNQLETQYEGK
jgi:hypothetical protein